MNNLFLRSPSPFFLSPRRGNGCWPVLVLRMSVRQIQSREISRGRRTILLLLGENVERFPEDFIFQLAAGEFSALKAAGKVSSDGRAAIRSQIVILEPGRHAKYPPYAFTEHGAIMAATVLNSPEAVAMSVFVVRAFMQMREQLAANAAILKRLAEIDKTLLEHDSALRTIWTKLQPLLAPPPEPPRRRIGFHAADK
jgi:hypothetical protein